LPSIVADLVGNLAARASRACDRERVQHQRHVVDRQRDEVRREYRLKQ
jgi:hypothetical protein